MKIKTACLFIFLCFHFICPAQSIKEQMMARQPDCRDVMINASAVVPQLYAEKSFDSISVAVSVMEQVCSGQSQNTFYVKALLDIQQSTFRISDFNSNGGLDILLHSYIFTLGTPGNGAHPIRKYQYHYYHATDNNFY